jgi:DNA mismatch repair protein MSH5
MTTNRFPDLPQELEFVFLQGDEAFFKTPDMRQLDDEIGDLDAYIKDTEAMIVNELEEDILECETELRSTFEALGELDCMLSLAGCARDFGYVRPEIFEHRQGIDESGYEIINGRHPLQELITDDDYIPNNTIIDEIRRINILTGPNYSGKSTNMRQVSERRLPRGISQISVT